MAEPPTIVPDDAAPKRPEDAVPSTAPSCTGMAPSFREPVATTVFTPAKRAAFPSPGEWLDDFELLRLLGQGAIARVFLARQLSLDRQVALKISQRRGNEARTLARLEHDHIVQVFQQSVDEARNLLLLCMQYVPGTTLEQIRIALQKQPRQRWSGQLILESIDALGNQRDTFDPAALRDREFLARCDYFEAVCWLGSRLAEALAYAHQQGVLHRDIKPANILLNVYGRPLLADFNISSGPPSGDDQDEMFGGTLAYMAPEHLDALNADSPGARDRVGSAADIYSLGVVLNELLTGEFVLSPQRRGEKHGDYLARLASERRREPCSPRRTAPDVPATLDRVVRRCTDPSPDYRYRTAEEVAHALEGCLHLRGIERHLPQPGPLTRKALEYPLLAGICFAFLPHVLATAVNIHYNSLRIVSELSNDQPRVFEYVILGYNSFIWPMCVWVIVLATLLPSLAVLRKLRRMEDVTENEVLQARQRALALPMVALVCACLGWLPGGLIFPAVIDVCSAPPKLGFEIYVHFFISFAISGLIAITYSVLGLQFFALRVLYPQLWLDGQRVRTLPPAELAGLDRRLRMFQLLAGLIPLLAALMMLGVLPGRPSDSGYLSFRFLVTAMILLGSLGFTVAMLASAWLGKTLQVLTRGESGPSS